MYVLAHLSDPHLAPLPAPRIRELAGKRVLGYLHWRRRRHRIHRREQVDLLVRDLKAQTPDHVAVTGDLVNIALDAEFPQARAWLDDLGAPRDVTLVPGNHDAYVRPALAAHATHWQEFMRGDEPAATMSGFPFVRRRGPLALIGLSSAVPTAPFMATGSLGRDQIARLAGVLDRLAGSFRVVLVHHPPGRTRSGRFKRLTDAAALRETLARSGAELVLHGHDHVHALDWLEGPGGAIPALGVPSASAAMIDGHQVEPAAYNLYRVEGSAGAWRCEVVTRGFRGGGGDVVEIARRELDPARTSVKGTGVRR
jgi:3',5'-cyclic AMP phosphodiesterase CpdA